MSDSNKKKKLVVECSLCFGIRGLDMCYLNKSGDYDPDNSTAAALLEQQLADAKTCAECRAETVERLSLEEREVKRIKIMLAAAEAQVEATECRISRLLHQESEIYGHIRHLRYRVAEEAQRKERANNPKLTETMRALMDTKLPDMTN